MKFMDVLAAILVTAFWGLNFSVIKIEHHMVRITKPARDKINAIKANDRWFSHLNQGYLTPSALILASPFGKNEKKDSRRHRISK